MTPLRRNVPRRWERLIPVLLIALVAAAYSNSLSGTFIGDDFPAIVNNPDIRTISGSLRAINDDRGSSVSGRPVVSLTFAVNHALHGLDIRGYHAANLAIHVSSMLLLYGLIRRTISRRLHVGNTGALPAARGGESEWAQRRDHSSAATFLAAVAAAIWAVHPLHTECINYVVQRTELLVGFFFVLMLYAVARCWDSERKRAWSTVAILACLLGMASKEVMAAGPVIAILYDYTFFSGSFVACVRRRKGFWAGLAACWVALAAILAADPRGGSVGFQHPVSAWSYLLTQTTVLLHYLRLAVWPAPLVISYHDWPNAKSILSVLPQALLLTGALVVSVCGLKQRKCWGFLGVSSFLVLAPSSSFVPIVTEIAAERRMYLPLMAIVLIVLVAMGRILRRRLPEPAASNRRTRIAGLALTLSVIAMLSVSTFLRNRDYRTQLSIWSDAARKRPGNAVAHGGVSYGLRENGDLQGALRAAEEAVRLDPKYIEGHFYRAHALQLLGRDEEAVDGFRELLRLDPTHTDAMYRLSLSLGQVGRWVEADALVERIVEVQPGHTRAMHVRAVSLSRLGHEREALAAARRAVELDPAFPDARYNLAWLLAQAGDHVMAAAHFKTVLASNPDDLRARFLLGRSLERLGDKAGAIREYQRVLQLDPKNAEARDRLRDLDEPGEQRGP